MRSGAGGSSWRLRHRKPLPGEGALVPAMPNCSIFISLLLFLPGVSPYCYTATAPKCRETTPSMPWHSLVGKGIDITTLGWTEASLLDTSLWQGPDGTCTLCQSLRQDRKVPLAVVDWKENAACKQEVRSSVEESAGNVAQAVASAVTSDWKKELGLMEETKDLALGGARSPLASFAYEKEQQDKYMFVLSEVSCVYYRLRLTPQHRLAPQFSQALHQLPPSYEPDTYRSFLATYGTHYLSQAVLGGLVRQLSAIPTCRAVLDGLTDAEIRENLGSEFLEDLGLNQFSSDSHTHEPSSQGNLSSPMSYMEKRVEVIGGSRHTKELFSTNQSTTTFAAWLESLKASPGLVSYSLGPIHTLASPGDPRREALRQAVKEYVAERGQRMCPWSCSEGGYFDSLDPCTCHCSGNPLTNSMCCSLRRGGARLKVRVMSGKELWGDVTTNTDAYVKVFFQGQELRTSCIANNDNPEWNEDLDFGAVTLPEKPKLNMQVWDSDVLPDDLMGGCFTYLKAGRNVTLKCNLERGHVVFSYSLECGPNLGGDSCQEYVPVRGYGERTQESSPTASSPPSL
ncbi:perforin-1-like isoform X2 [Pelodiscus sinensis]|uniref:perforin-1-like isoform X2 n=1 Tax=Pelodiscus sinensis TaxID=13735 RepID=UPI003F6C8A0C